MGARDVDRIDEEDFTVADMSNVESSPLARLRDELIDSRDLASGDIRGELQDAEERRAVILGTLKAALSLGLIYVVVFGAFIALLVWIWS